MDTNLQIILLLFILLLLFYLFHGPEKTTSSITNGHVKCLKCPPGWGVTRTCTQKANTACRRCATGITYSSSHSSKSPCRLCSKCGIGLFEAHKCTPIKDTVCDECISFIDHKNFTESDDFTKKCSYIFKKKNKMNSIEKLKQHK